MQKFSHLQIIRRISQFFVLIFFTGMFALAFSGFQTLYTSLINHNFSFAKLEMFWVPLGIVLILCLLLGRVPPQNSLDAST
jgi:NosR/NirI family nitrous oxide reductase transcriptional regulator